MNNVHISLSSNTQEMFTAQCASLNIGPEDSKAIINTFSKKFVAAFKEKASTAYPSLHQLDDGRRTRLTATCKENPTYRAGIKRYIEDNICSMVFIIDGQPKRYKSVSEVDDKLNLNTHGYMMFIEITEIIIILF
jgi:hypothetical protein